MDGERITDLEKFAIEHVWRPYQNKMGYEKRLDRLPVSLEETAKLLVTDETGWSKLVLDRIAAIGFRFPSYISHPLVNVIEVAQHVRRPLPHSKEGGKPRDPVNNGDSGE